METQKSAVPMVILRIGLAAVILWFGASQLMQPDMWTSWVPGWTAVLGITPETIVFLNGLFEVATGAMLALGIFTRLVAAALTVHMAMIVFEIGLSAIGVRDFGLMIGFLALTLESEHRFTLARN